jgi:hypothetical protein
MGVWVSPTQGFEAEDDDEDDDDSPTPNVTLPSSPASNFHTGPKRDGPEGRGRMKTTYIAAAGLALSLGLLGASRLDTPVQAAGPPAVTQKIGGVTWETSLASAQARARREGKPVLLLSLFGRLDEEFC